MKHFLFILTSLITIISCQNNGEVKRVVENAKVTKKDTLAFKEEVYDSKTALKLDSLFKKWVARSKFNGNILIAQRGKVIYKKCFGYANYEKKWLLNYNSEFQLASISKQFTAAAVMMLVERGMLNYTDSIQKFIPDFPFKNITIDMLLSHRSGLANYMYFCESYCTDYEKPVPNQQVIDWMISNKPQPYKKPGRRFKYNNTNYCLLASVVEKVSGMPFDIFLKTQLFEPLGMNNTWIKTLTADTLDVNLTQGYEYSWHKAEVNYLDGVVGDKNVYSTIEDLFKWDQALYTNKVLTQITLSNAFAPKSKELWGIKNYGYGWRLLNYPDGTKMVYHNGWWHGYNNSFFRRLNDQTTIIILSNRRNKEVYQTASIFEILDNASYAIDEENDV